ncbi:Obg family GTPase [Pedosphaera parvula]|uniref:GTPase Obg n=1 Tax=Pedosphaera parvula (strain Ellin514) TaxID=320771 RepID=B9XSM3_PEDPL|nr:GTPase ObgE [Pedosphaera parvula]EEF57142.1 GTP-binding protein Obg/CgtA [Pedosphaera parvula Ellin514]
MFIDEIKIYARAGHGGKGCVAFHREAYITKGGPSGGNGGRGGNVILQADHDLNNLIHQFYNPRLIAETGEAGMGKGMDGHAGKDIIVKVPCGTLVWRLPEHLQPQKPVEDEDEDEQETETPRLKTAKRPVIRHSGTERALEINLEEEGDEEEKVGSAPSNEGEELVADLTVDGQQFVLCKGGRGGLGNRNFATARHQTPRFAQPGEPGDEGNYRLELRLIAEVGLVGYPNAGKSTLLTAISRARPKIAPYPFTTLHPQIGIVEYADFARLTVCDVPGLIEGAHNNVGLGHAFLRHIERCKILVLLIDMAGTDNRAPWDDYKQLLSELELHDPTLLEKPRLVVANKMDEAVAEENLKIFKRKIRKTPVLPIAAAFDEGVEKFKLTIREAVEAAKEPQK